MAEPVKMPESALEYSAGLPKREYDIPTTRYKIVQPDPEPEPEPETGEE